MISPSSDNAILDTPANGEEPVEVLLRLASSVLPFRSADGRLFVQVPVGERFEIHGLRSTAFRDWLIDLYLGHCGEFSTDRAMRRVLGAFEARARFDEQQAIGLHSRRARRLGG